MWHEPIPIEIKKKCLEMRASGFSARQIYNEYYKKLDMNICAYETFRRYLTRWAEKTYPDNTTLNAGTYHGFIAHDATVQVSSNGDIVQAWIKQKSTDIDVEEFLEAIKGSVEKYEYKPINHDSAFDMLEIPLFDMHWGVSFLDYYEPVLNSILDLIRSHKWKRIVIPFGQDFFHNDNITKGETTRGTAIEKVDMKRAVKEGKTFIFTLIDTAVEFADEVRVLYTAGNHDRSISWMFVQVLIERYGPELVDDSLAYRKIITYGKNAVMITHGDSKQATPANLAQIFPVSFPEEFAKATVREVHSGHLHHESETDIHGVMVRRLSSGTKTDEWSDKEDFVGTHKRFMVFEWSPDKLKSIHYI